MTLSNKYTVKTGQTISVQILTITPALAEELLTKNCANNRSVQRRRVRQYASDMIAGRWKLSDQPISFNTRGELVNGQHRLLAVVTAQVAFQSLVLHGLPDESMLVLDSGRMRSTDNAMAIYGYDAPKGSGATVRRLFNGPRNDSIFSDSQVLSFVTQYRQDIILAHQHLKRGRLANASTRAVLARAAIRREDPARLAAFAATLQTGIMVPGDGAAVRLRNMVLEPFDRTIVKRQVLYGCTETVLQQFLAGEDGQGKVRFSDKELFPIPGEGSWFE